MRRLNLFALGTPWEIEVDGLEKKTELTIFDFLDEFENKYSRFKPNSLLNKMSTNPGVYDQSSGIMELWRWYEKVYTWTDGVFTPMIGKNMDEIGYDSIYSLQPKTVYPLPSWQDVIELEKDKVEIKKSVQLDFGGAGKGWAVDQIGKILKENQVGDFCINAGGDILVYGKKREVALENPLDLEEAVGVAKIENGSICGSAASRRRWGSYHHIFNPIKQESPKEINASWAVAKTAMVADTMSTCVFLGQVKNLIGKIDFEYVKMDANSRIHKSLNMPAEFFYGNN